MDINTLFAQNEWAFFAGRALMLAIALIAFAVGFGRWRRSGSEEMRRMAAETRALSDITQRLALQLAQMESRLEDRRHLDAASVAPAGQRGYDLALQMARNGARPEELVNASGVTRTEAQLLARLHNPAH